jgi:hypothetical protein
LIFQKWAAEIAPSESRSPGGEAGAAIQRRLKLSESGHPPRSQAMAMKIKAISAVINGIGPVPGTSMVLVNTTVEFEGGPDSITFSVAVPNEGTQEQQKRRGNEKAKTLAQRYIDFPN